MHGPKSATPWSTEHWTVVAPLGVKPKVGLESLVGPEGPLSIVTVGASVSTLKSRIAVSVFPAGSDARTRKVQLPSASVPAVWLVPDVHGPKSATPWSTEHWTVVAPLGVKPKVGLESLVGPEGPLSIVTVGASVSTLKSRIAVSVFPAGSDTRTRKVQLPSASGPAAWDVPRRARPEVRHPLVDRALDGRRAARSEAEGRAGIARRA